MTFEVEIREKLRGNHECGSAQLSLFEFLVRVKCVQWPILVAGNTDPSCQDALWDPHN